MARLISSFYLYLVDLWRRCFAKSYLVKAEGNSPLQHDFRRCWKCGYFVASLCVQHLEGRCTACNALLHKKGECVNEKKDRRVFILHRSLYRKSFALMQLFFVLCVVAGLSIFRIKPVPDGYVHLLSSSMLWCIVVLGLFMIAWPAFGNIESRIFSIRNEHVADFFKLFVFPILLLTFSAVIFLLLYFGSVPKATISGKSVVPFWEVIPTQRQIFEQQRAELQNMPLNAERFSFAQQITGKNPLVDLQKEYVQIVVKDFSGLMKTQSDSVRRLAHGSREQQEFYGYYRNYLATLDQGALQEQCEHDPWNLATAETLILYRDVWDQCQQK